MVDLEKGDFLYQSDQEIFLVVTGETEDSYRFAVHGWREIGKDRLDYYLDDEKSEEPVARTIIHHGDDVKELIEKEGTEEEMEKFEHLKRLFEKYKNSELSEDGPHTDFTMDDT